MLDSPQKTEICLVFRLRFGEQHNLIALLFSFSISFKVCFLLVPFLLLLYHPRQELIRYAFSSVKTPPYTVQILSLDLGTHLTAFKFNQSHISPESVHSSVSHFQLHFLSFPVAENISL